MDDPKKTELVPGVGRLPYPAYTGDEPYIFVSYSHADSDRVFDEIRRFNEAGYHVWYDEGIAPGNEWTDEIAAALEKCTLFVVFLTKNSVTSKNVKNEIDFAIDDNIPAIGIYLEECELTGGLKLRFRTVQAILRYTIASEEEYAYRFRKAFDRYVPRTLAEAPADKPAQQPEPRREEERQNPETPPAKPDKKPEAKPRKKPDAERPAQKKKKKILLSVVAALLVTALVVAAAAIALSKREKPAVEIGDVIQFGAYEQDGDETNGKEAIDWIVLDKQDGKALVVSKYLPDRQRYNAEFATVTWETCTLRTWLNGTFLQNAFSEEEQAKLLTATADADFSFPAENDTGDKVFLLSVCEANQYFSADESRKCALTAAASAADASDSSQAASDGHAYWLRTSGTSQNCAAVVDSDGAVNDTGAFVVNKPGVRPAMWISL